MTPADREAVKRRGDRIAAKNRALARHEEARELALRLVVAAASSGHRAELGTSGAADETRWAYAIAQVMLDALDDLHPDKRPEARP